MMPSYAPGRGLGWSKMPAGDARPGPLPGTRASPPGHARASPSSDLSPDHAPSRGPDSTPRSRPARGHQPAGPPLAAPLPRSRSQEDGDPLPTRVARLSGDATALSCGTQGRPVPARPGTRPRLSAPTGPALVVFPGSSIYPAPSPSSGDASPSSPGTRSPGHTRNHTARSGRDPCNPFPPQHCARPAAAGTCPRPLGNPTHTPQEQHRRQRVSPTPAAQYCSAEPTQHGAPATQQVAGPLRRPVQDSARTTSPARCGPGQHGSKDQSPPQGAPSRSTGRFSPGPMPSDHQAVHAGPARTDEAGKPGGSILYLHGPQPAAESGGGRMPERHLPRGGQEWPCPLEDSRYQLAPPAGAWHSQGSMEDLCDLYPRCPPPAVPLQAAPPRGHGKQPSRSVDMQLHPHPSEARDGTVLPERPDCLESRMDMAVDRRREAGVSHKRAPGGGRATQGALTVSGSPGRTRPGGLAHGVASQNLQGGGCSEKPREKLRRSDLSDSDSDLPPAHGTHGRHRSAQPEEVRGEDHCLKSSSQPWVSELVMPLLRQKARRVTNPTVYMEAAPLLRQKAKRHIESVAEPGSGDEASSELPSALNLSPCSGDSSSDEASGTAVATMKKGPSKECLDASMGPAVPPARSEKGRHPGSKGGTVIRSKSPQKSCLKASTESHAVGGKCVKGKHVHFSDVVVVRQYVPHF